ncbi:MAG: proline dehydrogenase family protein [Gammaproteobacteria bacterium]
MKVSLLNRAVAVALPYVPQPVVWRVSRRYIAGTSLDDALHAVADLNAIGVSATIDVLGEDVRTASVAQGYRDLYLRAMDEILASNARCYVSVKLTEMGLRVDEGLCRDILDELAAASKAHGSFLRIDMEDSSVTSVTLDIYRQLRKKYDRIGVVLQACLHRTEDDIAALLDEGIANVRLCKGIYLEPEEIAFQGRQEIRDAFARQLRLLIRGDAEFVAIATHDPPVAGNAVKLLRETGFSKSHYEFQSLLGVAEGLRDELVASGHPLRVYVPFGEAWFAYSLRRLRENPQIAGHIMRNLFRHG